MTDVNSAREKIAENRRKKFKSDLLVMFINSLFRLRKELSPEEKKKFQTLSLTYRSIIDTKQMTARKKKTFV